MACQGDYTDEEILLIKSVQEETIKKIKSKLLTKGRRLNRTYVKEVLDNFM